MGPAADLLTVTTVTFYYSIKLQEEIAYKFFTSVYKVKKRKPNSSKTDTSMCSVSGMLESIAAFPNGH